MKRASGFMSFGEVEVKRAHVKAESGSNDDVQCTFDSHLPSSVMFSEICSLQLQLAKHEQQKKELDETGKQELPPLPDFLNYTSGSDDRRGSWLTPEECLQRLVETAQGGRVAPGSDQVSQCLLSTEQRVKVDVLKMQLKTFRDKQPNKWSHFVTCMTKENLPLELFWRLDTWEILPLPTLLDSVLKDRGRCEQWTQQLLKLSSTEQDADTCRLILSAVCGHLVKIGFPEKKMDDTTLRKTSIGILDGITRGLLDQHLSAQVDLLLHASLLNDSPDVPHVSVKKFCTHTVSLIMSHCPNMKVSEALKRQEEWKSGKVSTNLKTLFKQLLVPFESVEVVGMLRRILEKQEVSWQTLLSFMATFLVCFPSAAADIHKLVARLLSESLESGDMENTIVAFLLARQSCVEGPHVAASYPHWFEEIFGDSSKSPAGSKKSFTFLVKFLTDLVPFEPADILKVHILRPPFIPAKCRDLWKDYILLAKTRLADLKVSLEETDTAIYTNQGDTAQVSPGTQDVEKALAVFESSGKLPTTIMEASIFRKPYFVGRFLPALLQPRHLPDVADGRMKFIEALKKAGKIPSSLFCKYEEDCKRETRMLLEGVFEEMEEDGVEEMLMVPMEQLSYRLQQLSDAVRSLLSDARVSEIVSVISEKILMVIGAEGARVAGSGSQETAAELNLCRPCLLPSHVKVIDAVLNCVCRTLHGVKDESKQSWLDQLIKMLSQHRALHSALFIRLLTLFSTKPTALSEHQVHGVAAFVFHLSCNNSLFSPLCVSGGVSGERGQTMFLLHFLRHFSVSGEREMLLTLSFLTAYLKAHFLNLHTSPSYCSSDVTTVMPRLLVTMFTTISWRLLAKSCPTSSTVFSIPHGCLPSWVTADNFPGSETGQRKLEAAVKAVYFSEKFQKILETHQPTLEDWVDLELRVRPSCDWLSWQQREMYHMSAVAHFSGTAATDDVKSNFVTSCSVLMRKLATALSRQETEPPKCPRCQLPLRGQSTGGAHPEGVSSLLSLFTNLTQKLASGCHDSVDGDAPWLVQQALRLLSQDAPASQAVHPPAVLRVILSCPATLLFDDHRGEYLSHGTVLETVRFTEEVLRDYFSEGGILSLDVICHLLQGYADVRRMSRDKTATDAFEKHPLVVLSTMVHWQRICALVPSFSGLDSPLTSLRASLDIFHNFFEGRGLNDHELCPDEPFNLAAALHTKLIDRDWQCEPERRKEVVVALHRVQPQAIEMLSSLLVVSLSDGQICYPSSSKQLEGGLLWLSDLWGRFPHLLSSVGDGHSHFSRLTKALTPANRRPFSELAIVRCIETLSPESVAGEKAVLGTVVCLFARLCRRFEETSDDAQGSTDVRAVLELPAMLSTLMKAAPLSAVRALDAADVKMCGMAVFRHYQQRLANRN